MLGRAFQCGKDINVLESGVLREGIEALCPPYLALYTFASDCSFVTIIINYSLKHRTFLCSANHSNKVSNQKGGMKTPKFVASWAEVWIA